MTAPQALAVIIARAGSKGLPGKNAKTLCNRPLVSFSLDAARSAKHIERTIVSTDCPSVRAAAESEGVQVIARPAELATDFATVDAAARHAVDAARSAHPIVIILYANVPLRPVGLIDRAIETLIATGADSVQSYASVGKHHPAWMVRLDGASRVIPYEPSRIHRRQDLPPVFLPDGGVIAVTRESLFTVIEGEPHAFLGKDRRGITTKPGEVVDIDDAIDLALAEAVLRARGETSR